MDPPSPPRMNTALAIDAGQYSSAGLKENNEDACGIRIPDEPLLTTKGIAAVIADGVSSSAGGREASETCVQGFLNDYYSTPESWVVKTSGQRVLGALNRWLHGQGQHKYRSAHGMITTLSALVIKSCTAHLFHVGDTRIYRLRNGELECLTRDHQLWSAGEKTFLCRAMGADTHVEIDYRSLPVEAGDLFLLTTDGVHGWLAARDLRALLERHRQHPEQAARMLVQEALARGSEDNATCQVVAVRSLPQLDEEAFYRQLVELPFPPPLEDGMVLDGYRILRELHASNRTQVYLALDTETREKVVLKTPSVNYEDDAAYIDRFLHEEWAGRRIHNPHVLRVLEPRRRRRFLYYVTEYVEGQTLRQWIHDHPLPSPAEVRPLVEQMAAGLRAFHRQEMIHQDLKPENILIDTHGTVKLLDFGSTRIAGIQEIASPLHHDHPLGTLDYAAPEYFRGYPGTSRSDLYSLGVITYEMLTGHLPYGGPLSARNLKRVRYRPAGRHNPEVPLWMDKALQKAVHLQPQRRYESLSEFTYDLSHPNPAFLQEDVPLLERDPTAFWRALALLEALALLALLLYLAH